MPNNESQPNNPESVKAERSRLGNWIARMRYVGKHRGVEVSPDLANEKMMKTAADFGGSVREKYQEMMQNNLPNQGSAPSAEDAALSTAIEASRGGTTNFQAMKKEYDAPATPQVPGTAIQEARPIAGDYKDLEDLGKLHSEVQPITVEDIVGANPNQPPQAPGPEAGPGGPQ